MGQFWQDNIWWLTLTNSCGRKINVLQSNLLTTWQQVWNEKQMDSLVNSKTELGQVNITWHSADGNLIQILYNTHKPQDMFLSEWLPDVFSHFWYGTAQKVFG